MKPHTLQLRIIDQNTEWLKIYSAKEDEFSKDMASKCRLNIERAKKQLELMNTKYCINENRN